MKCIIIRHGRTSSNDERRYAGCKIDSPLTTAGREELINCIEKVKDDKCMLVTSPMKRAVQTAEIMFPGIVHQTVDDLMEMDFGKFEGKNYEELEGDPDYQEWIDSRCLLPIPEGESMDSFSQRSVKGLMYAVKLAEDHGAQTLIIVAHGGTIMAVMSTLFGKNFYDYYSLNGEGYSFRLEADDAGNINAAGTYDSFCGRVHS